ncbi:MAG: squalene--hopene cyclase [Fuerstiella sp.]|nr:squalene--hopene cyclase [Fuerstiella sp.]
MKIVPVFQVSSNVCESATHMSVVEAADVVTDLLVSARNPRGWWTGELSTSALSTATAVMALELARRADIKQCDELIRKGIQWLANHQNPDGGWGDTSLSHSNISTSMLVNAVFRSAAGGEKYSAVIESSQQYIQEHGGVDAVIQRYGKDRTFSAPILTHCALAGVIDWNQVMPLPFELACIPARFYNAVRMPVVSYALPALIAIGQVIFHHRGHWNPVVRNIRRCAIKPSLKVLERVQPENGGFLEATPLTSFVCMSLLGCGLAELTVTRRCLDFIVSSVRKDGSWPIDTNLTTWVTSLSINALAGVKSCNSSEQILNERERDRARTWILDQQYQKAHPYTHAAPGGWAWTDLPGGVPDGDDTPGAMLALLNLRSVDEEFSDREISALSAAAVWLLDLQNRDGGWPTFCRGWGTLPFDRSSSDLTAHVLRALNRWLSRIPAVPESLHRRVLSQSARGLKFLEKHQTSDGAWLPLWFGNQWHDNDENPLYGTSRVVVALREIGYQNLNSTQKGLQWLLENQNSDGSWSGQRGLPGSIEETSLAIEALSGHSPGHLSVRSGTTWLIEQIQAGQIAEPSPIGFYFAKLWYFERLYPIIFATAALRRVCQNSQF